MNLKHAWEFILDEDVLQSETNYYMLCHIARIVNEGFFYDGGRIRGVPVTIGGSNYIPPLPVESIVREQIAEITRQDKAVIDIAIELCLYCMKTQVFLDGNKRVSVIFANHYLIAHGICVVAVSMASTSFFLAYLRYSWYDKKREEKQNAKFDDMRLFFVHGNTQGNRFRKAWLFI